MKKNRRVCLLNVVLLVFGLSACTSVPHRDAQVQVIDIASESKEADDAAVQKMPDQLTTPASWLQGDDSASATASKRWQHFAFPGKSVTNYRFTQDQNRDALHAQSKASSSMVRRDVNLPASVVGSIQFSWKVPQLLETCDVAQAANDDSPVRILLTFEGDRSKFNAKNTLVSEMASLLLGEPLPYATLVYVWSRTHPLESIIPGQRTDRVRSIVVESGAGRLNQWLDYQRDIRVDFQKAFGEAPGALLRVALMTDSDNTKSQTSAWYGVPVFVKP